MANRHPSLHAPRGFTLVELLVAAVIMSVALLGIYSVFVAAVEAESRTTARWHRRAAARAAADHIAASLQSAVNLPDTPAIAGGPDAHGGYALECLAQELPASHGSSPRPSLVRRRYQWGDSDSSGPGSSGPGSSGGDSGAHGRPQGVQLRVQTRSYAGTKDVTALDAEAAPPDDPAGWALVPPVILVSRLTSLRVAFRPSGDPEAPWQDHYKGPAGELLVRVTAAVGPETVERVIFPKANGDLVPR